VYSSGFGIADTARTAETRRSLTCAVRRHSVLMGFAGVRRRRAAGLDGRRPRRVAPAEPAQDAVDGELVMGFGARLVLRAGTAAGRFRMPRRRLHFRHRVVETAGRRHRLPINAGRPRPVRV